MIDFKLSEAAPDGESHIDGNGAAWIGLRPSW